ncbi:MAG: beta-lactamase family protein, partial [Bacteroidota bacterium]|nr:beta-lactamase family protein [Bacteroidota bacterium]
MKQNIVYKTHLFYLLLFAIVFCAITNSSFAQNEQATYQPPRFTDNNRLQKIESTFAVADSIFKAYAEKNHFPAVAFGLVVDGKLVHANAFGFTDILSGTKATPASLFRIASMT